MVVDGLLRQGETANVIAAPKVGKSWLTYGLALSKATGRAWLVQFDCPAGRVLIIDNELHPETIAHRIPTVADAMQIKLDEYHDQIDVVSLRGRLMDLFDLERVIANVEADVYDLIVGDAWYRFIPKGVSENDNADVMLLYNQLDKYMGMVKAAWAGVHHATKGSQGEKAITDVGAGAGAQARAADTHIILREHEQPGIVVLEAALRSFKPVEPLALEWQFPIWLPAEGVDTEKLKGKKSKGEEKQEKLDSEADDAVLDLTDVWRSVSELHRETGISDGRIARAVRRLEKAHLLDSDSQIRRGNTCKVYRKTFKAR